VAEGRKETGKGTGLIEDRKKTGNETGSLEAHAWEHVLELFGMTEVDHHKQYSSMLLSQYTSRSGYA
jgi:hypothetical protein